MSNWSKLQRELYKIIDSRIDFQIHCVAYRINSQRGNTKLPRYFITLGKEIIFDYPSRFIGQDEVLNDYLYINDISNISDLIREYIDAPTEELFDKPFADDKWQLTEILKAADRRIGKRRLEELSNKTKSESAKAVIIERLNIKKR